MNLKELQEEEETMTGVRVFSQFCENIRGVHQAPVYVSRIPDLSGLYQGLGSCIWKGDEKYYKGFGKLLVREIKKNLGDVDLKSDTWKNVETSLLKCWDRFIGEN